MKPTVEFDDRVLNRLSNLPPDPLRATRTRQRCRAALQRRGRHTGLVACQPPARPGPRLPATWELALRKTLACAVGILCVVYVAALIAITASLQETAR